MQDDGRITRRASLVRAGGVLGGLLGAAVWKAAEPAGAGPAGVASGELSCILAPEQTEGPYYIDGEKLRQNITEGRPGTPLKLRLKVVNATTCKPIKGALVDIWHADAGASIRASGRALPTGRSCAGSRGRTERAWRCSARFTRAGTRVAPCTST